MAPIPKGSMWVYGIYLGLKLQSRYMGTNLGPKYIPYTYMDPLGQSSFQENRTGNVLGLYVKRPGLENLVKELTM